MSKTCSMTIKHISAYSEVQLYAASRVCFTPATAPNIAAMPDMVYADLEDGSTISFDSGTVYVMNAAGKTVQRFDLALPLDMVHAA